MRSTVKTHISVIPENRPLTRYTVCVILITYNLTIFFIQFVDD